MRPIRYNEAISSGYRPSQLLPRNRNRLRSPHQRIHGSFLKAASSPSKSNWMRTTRHIQHVVPDEILSANRMEAIVARELDVDYDDVDFIEDP